jgi:hypothetical protein
MTIRTSTKTVTFTRPFVLRGIEGAQPAGTYEVETNEELLQTLIPSYLTLSTLIRLPARLGGAALNQVVDIDSAEMTAALARDAKPESTALREEEAERRKAYWDSRE